MGRKALAIAACALLCALCLMMPSAVLAVKDRSLSGARQELQAEDVSLNLFTELTPLEKLSLIPASTLSPLSVAEGRVMDEDAAVKCAQMVLSVVDTDPSPYQTYAEPQVWVANDMALTLWSVEFSADDFRFKVLIDDETGCPLSLTWRYYEWPDPKDGQSAMSGESSEPSYEWMPEDDGGTEDMLYIARNFLGFWGMMLDSVTVSGDTATVKVSEAGMAMAMRIWRSAHFENGMAYAEINVNA